MAGGGGVLLADGGAAGHPTEQPPVECTGGMAPVCGGCTNYRDVVCSWARVTLGEGGAPPCDQAAALIDPSEAPLGGAGGDWPGRNACSGYSLADEDSCGDSCCHQGCRSTLHEDRVGTCTIAGHCCVLVDVQDCFP